MLHFWLQKFSKKWIFKPRTIVFEIFWLLKTCHVTKKAIKKDSFLGIKNIWVTKNTTC